MKLSIKTNFPDVQRQLDQLHKDISVPAAARAVNRTLEQGKTAMQRAIVAEFNVKAAVVRESLVVRRAWFHKGSFTLEGTLASPTKRGRSRNLIHFGAKQTGKGVTVKILRAGPRKLLRSAFIINRDNQYGGTVMVRKGDKRLPIQSRVTVDVAQMFNTKRVNAIVVRFIRSKFPEIFAREVKFYTDRFNARRASL